MEQSLDTAQQVRAWWEAFGKSQDTQTRSYLIGHYLPLAKIIAAKLYGLRPGGSGSFDDYLQYARVGLMECVDRYDVSRNVSFESYATHRIRGAILNGIGHESEVSAQRSFWRTRMPDRLQSVAAGAGSNPERASLQELIDITVGIAIGLALDEEENDQIDETLPSNPYAATELDQFIRLVRSLVDKLPERECEIVRGHYFEHLEFQVLAQHYSITKGRVSQLHARALTRLRGMLNEHPGLDRKV